MDKEKMILFAKNNRSKVINNFSSKLLYKEQNIVKLLKNSKRNSLNKLGSIYLLMDEINAYLAKSVPCNKGCSACCNYPVSISEIEIAYIEKKTKSKRLKNFNLKRNFMGTPCVFLKDNSCSIYDTRPFVCRKHHVLTKTSKLCAPKHCIEYEIPIIKFTSIEDAFNNLRFESKSYYPYDIREVF